MLLASLLFRSIANYETHFSSGFSKYLVCGKITALHSRNTHPKCCREHSSIIYVYYVYFEKIYMLCSVPPALPREGREVQKHLAEVVYLITSTVMKKN